MSNKRGGWISRRGQPDAATAIDQVIERQQPGEQVQMLPDERIMDSPYQARRPFDDESIEDLAEGMRETGFQGVLVTRPHSDPAQRRRGMVQLVYGHRRRVAWHKVCAERGEPCVLPVVVRDISDERMLTIGAQENLQRQDLDPIEEAQIVAWHERMFFDKNQAEIGAMLGKSVDWVKMRARIHKLPDALKERLRLRPRAISQMLELGVLYGRQPDVAIDLADRVVTEQMTLDALRASIRNYERPGAPAREEKYNQRGAAPLVNTFTTESPLPQTGEQASQSVQPQRSPVHVSFDAYTRPSTPPGDALTEATPIGGETASATWIQSLCDSLNQATQALHERREAILTLDDAGSADFQRAVEALLLELAFITDALQQRQQS